MFGTPGKEEGVGGQLWVVAGCESVQIVVGQQGKGLWGREVRWERDPTTYRGQED